MAVGHSGGSPLTELLDPTRKPLARIFNDVFTGMTRLPVTIGELEEARERLIQQLRASLTGNEREFLLSLKRADPQWDLLPIPHVARLPGIQWKLRNLRELARQPKQHVAAGTESEADTACDRVRVRSRVPSARRAPR